MGSKDLTSASLLHKAVAKDKDAWERLVRLYSPLVVYWCRQWGLRGEGVEDVTQEVFAAVAASLPTYAYDRPGATFRGWVRGITRHKLQDHFRRAGGRGEGGTAAHVRLQEMPDAIGDGDGETSDEAAEVSQLYRRALDLVRAQFEERTWTAFWKVAIENRSPAEVATELGLTPNAVRQAKSRILRRLKDEVGELIA